MTAPDPAPRSVRITTDISHTRVEVGGSDISQAVSGYTIEHRAGQIPLVALYAAPLADPVAFEGLATVALADQHTDGNAVAAWLRGIDPAALHRAALNRDDLDGQPGELTRATLAQLAEWAEGQP